MPPVHIILMAVAVTSELSLAIWKRSSAGDTNHDQASMKRLTAVYLSSLLAAILAEKLLVSAAFTNEIWRFLGLGVFIAGFAFRWFCIIWLGRYFTANLAVVSEHRLVTSGPYQWIRHPSYTGGLFVALGIGLSTGNAIALLLAFLPPTFALVWRIRLEEKVLLNAFGEDYRQYSLHTRKLLPGIW